MEVKLLLNKINSATLTWNQAGEPYSDLFGDLYFSSDDGLAESRYVFIEQNNLLRRWQQCQNPCYVIGETGFGSGLNFLAVCNAFEQFCSANPNHRLQRLYFISFEKYPLTEKDLVNAHQRWPQVTHYATQLQENYPSAIAGCHRLNFCLNSDNGTALSGTKDTALSGSENTARSCSEDRARSGNREIILDLWFGDISDTLPQLSYPASGLIDSWFLDGFAPGKNPEMWSQALYKNMALVTKDNATLATFTAAGHVRRGLAAEGFEIKRVKGFGKKREMITALFRRNNDKPSASNWYHRPQGNNITQLTIVGGGVASAALCLALAKRGIEITLICRDPELAQGASGNRQGGFYPLVNIQHDYLSQLYSQAFIYSKQTLKTLKKQGYQFEGEFCGALLLAWDQKLLKRYQQLAGNGLFPGDFMQWLSAEQASDIARVRLPHPALYFPQAAWLCPAQITKALVAAAQSLTKLEIKYDTSVTQIARENEQWQLSLSNNEQHLAQHLVLANGHQLTEFEQTRQLPLYRTSGQVTHIKTTPALKPLSTLLCYKGYLTPVNNGEHCIGASFERDKTNGQLTETEQRENISKLNDCTANAPWASSIIPDGLNGKVGVRLSAKDHLPMVGAVPQAKETQSQYHDLARGKPARKYPLAPHYSNLYMIGALGSRGLCSATLLAEILACQLTNEPQPVSQLLLDQLNPNRYWVRQLKSGKSMA